jgi:hypothetical protein
MSKLEILIEIIKAKGNCITTKVDCSSCPIFSDLCQRVFQDSENRTQQWDAKSLYAKELLKRYL